MLHSSPYKGSAPSCLCRQQKEGVEDCSQAGKHCLLCCCAPLGQELEVLPPPSCQLNLWPQIKFGLAFLYRYITVPAIENSREETRDRIKNTKAYWKAAVEAVEPKQLFAAAAVSVEGPGAGTAKREKQLYPNHLAGSLSIHTNPGKYRGGRREDAGGAI